MSFMLIVTVPKSTGPSLHDQIKVSEVGQCGQQRFALLSGNCALCLEIGLGLVPSPTRVQGAPDQFSVPQGHQGDFGPGNSSFCLRHHLRLQRLHWPMLTPQDSSHSQLGTQNGDQRRLLESIWGGCGDLRK